MYSSEPREEIKQRLKWELVLKSTTAVPAIVILALGISYFRFNVAYYADAVSVLAILCAINAGVRYFVGQRGVQKKIEKKKVIQFVFWSLSLNMMLWTILFLIVFLQTDVSSSAFALAFMISISLTSASVLTMAYSPGLAICYQLGLLSGNFIAFARDYIRTTTMDYLFMAMAMALLAFYYIRQTRDFYRQMFDRYRYEVELEISLKQLKDSNQKVIEETARAENASRLAALGEMAGGMAHEINTPLAIINLMIEQVIRLMDRAEYSKDDAKVKLNSALSAVSRISRIIKSLLHISRKGEDFDSFESLKVKDLLEDVLNLYQEKFTNAGIDLQVISVPDVMIRTKQVLISQVLLNLLSNAYDEILLHSDENKYLKIFFKTDELKLTIFIENSGPKISEATQDKIFQPFFTTREVGKGAGLGLSICKGIIESLKERIWLEKSFAKTTFCFTLPIVKTSDQLRID